MLTHSIIHILILLIGYKNKASLFENYIKRHCNKNQIKNMLKYRRTCVCVSPSDAASSALSGSARYCVFWNLLWRAASWKLE